MSGLKRSVSSPNIAKLIAEKMEVDKTSEVKPARNLPPKFHNPTFQVTKEQPIFGIPLDFYTKFVMKRKATLQGYEGCKVIPQS